MDSKLRSWFEVKGRRLVELKLKGGMEFFKQSKRDLDKLNIEEWMEFFILSGQLDGLTWMLQPDDPDEATKFYDDLKEFMAGLEEEIDIMKKITGKTKLPKGRA